MSRETILDAITAARQGQPLSAAELAQAHVLFDRMNLPLSGVFQPSAAVIEHAKSITPLAKLRIDGKVEAHRPDPNGPPTIGYGSTGIGIEMGAIWSVNMAEQRLIQRVFDLAAEVQAAIGDTPTTQDQFDALVSRAFEVGIDVFRAGDDLRAHKNGAGA